MFYKILEPLLHGVGAQIFSLKIGEVVEDSIFTKEQVAHLLEIKNIEACDELISKVNSETIPDLLDINEMTAVEAKEAVNNEVNVVNLEKFKDAENKNRKPRKTVVEFINSRIHELTGWE